MFCKFLIFVVALAYVTVSLTLASKCEKTGYTCYGFQNGDVNYCSQWQSSSVCYESSCYGPSTCTPDSSSGSAPTCVDSGFLCGTGDEGSSSYCSQYKPNSVCYSQHCYYPANCRDAKRDNKLDTLRSQQDTIDDLIKKLLAVGDDDTIPRKFERLIREASIESDFASDIDIGDVANVYRALGYQGTRITSSKTMQTFFDDELNIYNGKAGKALAIGTMSSDSFSIRACFDSHNTKPKSNKLELVNSWNEDYRMSSAWVDSKDGAVCLQSDVQFTKFDKANVQLAKEHAAIFAVSVQTFHMKWAKSLNAEL